MPSSRVLARRALAALGATIFIAPTGAQAAERWTTPTSVATSGACDALAPCRIDYAISGAAANDEVVVAPGRYALGAPMLATVPVDIHGVLDRKLPELEVTGGPAGPVLDMQAGGKLRYLAIRATGPSQKAVRAQGIVAEKLVLDSVSGDGAELVGDPGTTVLRDSVIRTTAGTTADAALRLTDSLAGGDVALRNVTAMATTGQATGIRCETVTGRSSVVNVITRGPAADIDATTAGSQCSAAHSNFRPALSPGVPAGDANQSGDPLFVNAGQGDYRAQQHSPTIDAGRTDALLGATDLNGRARILGSAPDIGAFERNPADDVADPENARPSDAPVPGRGKKPYKGPAGMPEELQDVTPPKISVNVVVGPATGKVRVKSPKGRFVALTDGARIPVGSTIDATRGQVTLVSAVGPDQVQAGHFWGSQFQVRQPRGGRGMTQLLLRGGNFAGCGRAALRHPQAVASGRRRAVRRLWGRDRGGRFSTHGRDSVATARGTAWLTEDRCEGTLTRVTEGAVAVRNLHTKRTTLVKAKRSYLARHTR